MPEPLFAITTSLRKSETIIKLSGECDISNVELLNTTIYDVLLSEKRRIVLDVQDLSFMGSCGLTPIRRVIDSLEPVGGVVVVKEPSPMLSWLLDVFGISQKALVLSRVAPPVA
jgi:anti-anti-sigma factor